MNGEIIINRDAIITDQKQTSDNTLIWLAIIFLFLLDMDKK